MECYCYLRNIQDPSSDGKIPYELRFGEDFKGPIIPFGALVKYHPISTQDQQRIHQFGSKNLPREANLAWRHYGRKQRGIGRDGRI